MADEQTTEILPGSLTSYALALFEGTKQKRIDDDDRIGSITMQLVNDHILIDITSGDDHTQPLGAFKGDLVHLMNNLGDAVITDKITMTAGPDTKIEILIHHEEPNLPLTEALQLLKHDFGNISH